MFFASPETCHRHALAWPAASPAHAPAPARAWLDAGGPGVIARWQTDPRDARPPALVLGVCLPPAAPGLKPGRCAVEFAAPVPLVRVAPPPALDEVLPAAPAGWRATLTRLREDGERLGVRWRVFGSLLWQHLYAGRGGAPFVNARTSDVDLLFAPADTARLDDALALLAAAAGHPFALDAEIIFPSGCAVHWREWARRPARVLAKHLLGPRFRTTEALRAELARGPASPDDAPEP